MEKFSRRRFIQWLTRGLGYLSLSTILGCRAADQAPAKSRASTREKFDTPQPSPTDHAAEQLTPSPISTSTAQPTLTISPTPAPASPDLVVTRRGRPQRLVKKAIRALGGMEQFVRPGDDVIIKPNICVGYHPYQYAATTNPWVVGTLVELALGYGAKRVRVMDYPFGGPPQQAYVRSGIQEQVEKAGGKMEIMAPFKFVSKKIPEGLALKKCKIYQDVLQADVLINVPIVKHHGLAKMTLAMKNLMGVIADRPAMHHNLGQRLADLSTRVRSHLIVVDAVRMLMNHGPSGGNLNDVKQADTVIAATDIVAADSYAATLFGYKPNNLSYVRAGSAMGLGRSDLGNLRIEELDVG
jgi:uncharacterized protein (DUF362 family)